MLFRRVRDTLVPLKLLDDLVTSNNILEQLLQVRRGIRTALEVEIEVLGLEQDVGGSSVIRKMRHPLLEVVLRDTEEVLQFAGIPKVGSIPGTREDLNGDILSSIRGREILDFEFVIHNLPQLVIVEVLESESVLDRESAGQSWVHVLLSRKCDSRDSSNSLTWNISNICSS